MDPDGKTRRPGEADSPNADLSRPVEPAEFTCVDGPDGLISPDNPLHPYLHLLLAVPTLHQVGTPERLSQEEESFLRVVGLRNGRAINRIFEPRKRAAQRAKRKIEAWGCEITDGVVKIPAEGRGRPVELFTVAVGLGWEELQEEYEMYAPEELCRTLLKWLRPFWPRSTWKKVQEATHRYRRNPDRYQDALDRLTRPRGD